MAPLLAMHKKDSNLAVSWVEQFDDLDGTDADQMSLKKSDFDAANCSEFVQLPSSHQTRFVYS